MYNTTQPPSQFTVRIKLDKVKNFVQKAISLQIILLMSVSSFLFSCENETLFDTISSSELDKDTKSSARQNVTFDKDLLLANKVDESMKLDVELIDGILHFKNTEVFEKYTSDISLIKSRFPEVFLKKEKEKESIVSEGEKITTEEELNVYLEKYSKHLVIKDSTVAFKNRGAFDFLFTDFDKNYFYVGKMIHLYEEDNYFLIIDGDKSKVLDCKQGNFNEKNIFVFNKPKISTKSAKTTYGAILYNEFYVKNRVYNGNRRRGTHGVIKDMFSNSLGVNGNGEPTFSFRWTVVNEGNVERRTLFLWFFVNSNLTLVPDYTFNVTLNGTNIANSYSIMPRPTKSNYNFLINDIVSIYTNNGSGGVVPLTQAQYNSLSYSIFNNSGGYFQTGQVPGVDIQF